MSEIEERQQAPIMVLISSHSLKYAYPHSAGGLVGYNSASISNIATSIIYSYGCNHPKRS